MENQNITNIVVECPHCKSPVLIEKLINPHTEKELCELYVKINIIFGCGKPFQVIPNENSKDEDDKFIAILCDYI